MKRKTQSHTFVRCADDDQIHPAPAGFQRDSFIAEHGREPTTKDLGISAAQQTIVSSDPFCWPISFK